MDSRARLRVVPAQRAAKIVVLMKRLVVRVSVLDIHRSLLRRPDSAGNQRAKMHSDLRAFSGPMVE